MEWVSGSMGSQKSMDLSCFLFLEVRVQKLKRKQFTYAGPNQHMDTGSKVFMLAPIQVLPMLMPEV